MMTELPDLLTLRHPTPDEMAIRRAWLADPEMMSYNRGWEIDDPAYDADTGCFDFSDDRWRDWYERWVQPATDRRYWFICDGQGRPVGHAHFRLDEDDHRTAHIGINIVPAHRRQGWGVRALELLIDEMRRDGRPGTAVNEFEDTRSAAVRTHRALGFRRTAPVGTAPDGTVIGRWELPLTRPNGLHGAIV